MKVLLAYPQVDMGGARYHRLHIPAMAMRAAGVDVTVVNDLLEMPEHRLTEFDVVIMNRTLTDKTELWAMDGKVSFVGKPLDRINEAITRIKSSGIRLVLDVDDTWNFPPSHPAYQHHTITHQREASELSIEAADLVWCSTVPLMNEVRTLNLNVLHVPNGISPLDPQWKNVPAKKPFPYLRIGVGAMYTSEMNLPRLREALRAMRKMHNWVLLPMGVNASRKPEVINKLGCERIIDMPVADVLDYAKYYQDIDLMLCPLSQTKFNSYRSDIKLAECAHSGTAVLCEDYGPYHGSGFCARQWHIDLPNLVREWSNNPEVLKKHIPNPTRYTTADADDKRLESLYSLLVNA